VNEVISLGMVFWDTPLAHPFGAEIKEYTVILVSVGHE